MIGFPQQRRTTLKKNRFTEEQIVAALRDAEASTIAEAARKHGVSEPSIHRWRKQYADIEVSDVRELKWLKDENGRLKKLLAERDLEVEVMKEIQAKKW
jgi:putative transposase